MSSEFQEVFYIHIGLVQDSPHCPVGKLTGMTRNSSASPSLWVPPDFMAPLCLAVKDKPSSPQLPDYFVGTEASKPCHQDTLTGIRNSPLAGAAACNDGGSSSPCS